MVKYEESFGSDGEGADEEESFSGEAASVKQ
jgi:hypothetical protein